MADKVQIKTALATVGRLAINVRDQLAESYDRITYTNLCENFKQQINELEIAYVAGSEDLTQVEQSEVLASLTLKRYDRFFPKLPLRVTQQKGNKDIKSLNAHNSVTIGPTELADPSLESSFHALSDG